MRRRRRGFFRRRDPIRWPLMSGAACSWSPDQDPQLRARPRKGNSWPCRAVPVGMRSLKARITLNTAKFLLALAVVLFVSAGTLRYWEAWVYLGLQLATMAATNVYLLKKDPALLERRL